VESPSVEIFKSQLDVVQGNWLWGTLLQPRVGLDGLPSDLSYSVIL